MSFDGFISYSHAADGRLAPAVQRGLHGLAKPWHRRRALWIFRDQTGLAVTPALWSSIQGALDASDYFVLLASPEAARSPWVDREIRHWANTKPAGRILPVVTDGEWAWDGDRQDFAEHSSAVPAALRGAFTEEPLFLDLRWARDDEHLSLRHSRFRDAIAQLAAPMHGRSKDDLEGEDVRQHRRARRLLSGAVTVLVLLMLVASSTGALAMRNAARANAAVAEMRRLQQIAAEQRRSAEWSAMQTLILGLTAHHIRLGTDPHKIMIGIAPQRGGDNATMITLGATNELASVHPDGSVLVWNIADPKNPVRWATITDDGGTAGLGAPGMGMWSVSDRADPIRIATLPDNLFTSMSFSPDGRTIATDDADGNNILWELADPAFPTLGSVRSDVATS
jgi:hypothetical protein